MLTSSAGRRIFEVKATTLADAADPSVLDQSGETVLRLLTHHPFCFVGGAPQRFVVRARLAPQPAAWLLEAPADVAEVR